VGICIGLGAIVLSIISLGMIDAIAMLPLSISATTTSGSVLKPRAQVRFLPTAFCDRPRRTDESSRRLRTHGQPFGLGGPTAV
jgi:hypothetical protein